jgi:hypothetical protein
LTGSHHFSIRLMPKHQNNDFYSDYIKLKSIITRVMEFGHRQVPHSVEWQKVKDWFLNLEGVSVPGFAIQDGIDTVPLLLKLREYYIDHVDEYPHFQNKIKGIVNQNQITDETRFTKITCDYKIPKFILGMALIPDWAKPDITELIQGTQYGIIEWFKTHWQSTVSKFIVARPEFASFESVLLHMLSDSIDVYECSTFDVSEFQETGYIRAMGEAAEPPHPNYWNRTGAYEALAVLLIKNAVKQQKHDCVLNHNNRIIEIKSCTYPRSSFILSAASNQPIQAVTPKYDAFISAISALHGPGFVFQYSTATKRLKASWKASQTPNLYRATGNLTPMGVQTQVKQYFMKYDYVMLFLPRNNPALGHKYNQDSIIHTFSLKD